MLAISASEFASLGKPEMSVFHGLSAGKTDCPMMLAATGRLARRPVPHDRSGATAIPPAIIEARCISILRPIRP